MTLFDGASILITGGTGSFGKKCAKYILDNYQPNKIVLFSRDEQKHVQLKRNVFPFEAYPNVRFQVGDVRDIRRLRRAFRGMDFVIHAAAMKHVDVAEYNPQECIATNINGALNVIDAAIDCGVKKVVALSTDKAANPINLYGATKLCSDKLFVAANSMSGGDGTRFSVVRYGNVVGSKGSVVPLFLEQRKRRVLNLTDSRMTRFWITLEQGVDFVCQSFERMIGGEIFVPKIPSMKMVDLAECIGPDCEINVVGIRPGEKLHECMISVEDSRSAFEFGDYFVIVPYDWLKKNKLKGGKPCPEGFSYTSDNNSLWISNGQMEEMIKPFELETA